MTPEETAAEIFGSYDYGPVIRSLKRRGFSRSEAIAFLADFACDYARQLGGDLGAVGRVTELLADAVYMCSADEHIDRAIEILDTLTLSEDDAIAVENAKAHLWLSMVRRGAE
ncbi:MAG: hypothetical protein IRZ03_18150 [Acidobacterium ailaaui]|nr:hypothetical protein [Pseudacidobacterium ailaaui]